MDERQQEQLVDQFLNELPPVALPPYFMERVMHQIVGPVFIPEKFRLTLLDFAIPAFATLFLVMLYWLSQLHSNWNLVDIPQLTLFESITLTPTWLYVALVFALGELILLLAIAWQWLEDRPLISLEF